MTPTSFPYPVAYVSKQCNFRENWEVNMHTTRHTGHVFVVLQLRLMSLWSWLWSRRSAPPLPYTIQA